MLPPSPVFIRYCLFVLALILLIRCGNSDLSTGPLTNPAQLQVNVVIHRRMFEDGSFSNFIKGYIKDATEKKDKWGHRIKEDGSSNQDDYITLIIGNGSGSHVIPLSYFKGPQTRFTALSLMLNSTKTVDVSRPFLKGSSLSSERTRLYRIELVE